MQLVTEAVSRSLQLTTFVGDTTFKLFEYSICS